MLASSILTVLAACIWWWTVWPIRTAEQFKDVPVRVEPRSFSDILFGRTYFRPTLRGSGFEIQITYKAQLGTITIESEEISHFDF